MDNNFLQSTLKSGLFDIGDSDDRLIWLQQAITDLVKQLKKEYRLLPKYSLVALDPSISDKEPILNDVEVIVTKYWKALRGKYPEMPRNIHRGVILDALYEIGKEDPIAARIIYLTTTNFYPYAKLGNEKEIVQVLLHDLGEIAEKHAVEEWSLIEEEPKLKLRSLKVDNLKFGKISIDRGKLQGKLQEMVSNSPSGHGPQGGLHEPNYQEHFIEKLTEAIAESFNSAFTEFNSSISASTIETPINDFFTAFKKLLDGNLKASFSSIVAVERRSKLLWWKETLYSSSLKRNYRGLSNIILPIIMAFDLNNQVAKVTPVSVDYLLRDTLYILNGKQNEVVKFRDFLSALSKDSMKSELREYFTELNENEGRISITEFIGLFLHERATAKDFLERTGIKDDEEVTLSNFSVVVFHDLLTKRLISK